MARFVLHDGRADLRGVRQCTGCNIQGTVPRLSCNSSVHYLAHAGCLQVNAQTAGAQRAETRRCWCGCRSSGSPHDVAGSRMSSGTKLSQPSEHLGRTASVAAGAGHLCN